MSFDGKMLDKYLRIKEIIRGLIGTYKHVNSLGCSRNVIKD